MDFPTKRLEECGSLNVIDHLLVPSRAGFTGLLNHPSFKAEWYIIRTTIVKVVLRLRSGPLSLSLRLFHKQISRFLLQRHHWSFTPVLSRNQDRIKLCSLEETAQAMAKIKEGTGLLIRSYHLVLHILQQCTLWLSLGHMYHHILALTSSLSRFSTFLKCLILYMCDFYKSFHRLVNRLPIPRPAFFQTIEDNIDYYLDKLNIQPLETKEKDGKKESTTEIGKKVDRNKVIKQMSKQKAEKQNKSPQSTSEATEEDEETEEDEGVEVGRKRKIRSVDVSYSEDEHKKLRPNTRQVRASPFYWMFKPKVTRRMIEKVKTRKGDISLLSNGSEPAVFKDTSLDFEFASTVPGSLSVASSSSSSSREDIAQIGIGGSSRTEQVAQTEKDIDKSSSLKGDEEKESSLSEGDQERESPSFEGGDDGKESPPLLSSATTTTYKRDDVWLGPSWMKPPRK